MYQINWDLDESKFLTEQEVCRLRCFLKRKAAKAVANDRKLAVRDWFVINLALSTGLRVSEIADLKCGDLLLDNGRSYLFVRNGKCGKQRVVRFNEDFRKHAIEFLEWKKTISEPVEPEAPLILSSHTKGRISSRALEKCFTKNAKCVGIKGHTFHHLRHTYASMLYKASGYNLRLVQKQLGHSSIMVTEIYANVLNPDLDRAMDKLYK